MGHPVQVITRKDFKLFFSFSKVLDGEFLNQLVIDVR